MASAASTVRARANQSQLARMLGVSRQAINELIKRGVLELGADGLLDVELAKVALANRVRASAKTAAALAGEPAADAGTAQATIVAHEANPIPAETMAATSYHVARTLREANEAKIAGLKLRRMAGELCEVEGVRRAAFDAFRLLRDKVMLVPRRAAPLVAGNPEAREVESVIADELRKALAEFETQSISDLGQDGDDGDDTAPAEVAA